MSNAKHFAALERAKEEAGNASRLAEMLGLTVQAVYQWKKVPAERCLEVERLTGIPRYELRSDIYGEGPCS